MNDGAETGYHGLPAPLVALVDGVCDQFERAWQQGGEPPRIEAYLESVPPDAQAALVRELILIEIPYRHRAGQSISVDDYAPRFENVPLSWLADALTSTVVGPNLTGKDTAKGHVGELPSLAGYELLGEVGRGAMGIVYRGRQLGLGREVAIKTLPGYATQHPELLARFRSEAESVAQLHHPGIVQIFDIDQQGAVPFFSMEYITGGSLRERIRTRPLSPRIAAEVVAELATAIHYAHQQGIVHRDLKPENILLAPCQKDHGVLLPSAIAQDFGSGVDDGYFLPKITDFGLAKRTDTSNQLTADGAVLGTPSYMAPEQAQGSTSGVGPLADVYGLGAVLYDALVGRPPFHAATILETIQQVVHDEPIPPSRIQPGVPRDLETICLKCLHKSPHHRYDSAAALGADLQRFLTDRPILARPTAWHERMVRWCRRNSRVAALMAALFVALISGIAGVTWQWRRAEMNAQNFANERDTVARERARAQRHLDRSRDAVDQMAAIGQRLMSTPGQERTGRDTLQRIVEFYEGFLNDVSDDPTVVFQAARACSQLGKICYSLGQWKLSEQAMARNRELLSQLRAQYPDQREYQLSLAFCLRDQANLLRDANHPAAAKEVYQEAIKAWEELVADGDPQGSLRISLANVLVNHAIQFAPGERPDEVEKMYLRAVELAEQAIHATPQQANFQLELASDLDALATFYLQQQRFRDAEELVDRSLEIRATHPRSPTDLGSQFYLARTYLTRARIFAATDRKPAAIKDFRQAEKILTPLIQEAPHVQGYRWTLVDVLLELCMVLDPRNSLDEMKSLRRKACEHFGLMVADAEPSNVQVRIRFSNALLNYAALLNPSQDRQEMTYLYQVALKVEKDALREAPNDPNVKLEHALGLESLGMLHFASKEYQPAEHLILESRQIRQQVRDEGYPVRDADLYLARSHTSFAKICAATKRPEEARASSQQAIQLLRALVDEFPANAFYRQTLVDEYLHQAALADAVGTAEGAAERLTAMRELLRLSRQKPTSELLRPPLDRLLNELIRNRERRSEIQDALEKELFQTLDEILAECEKDNPSPQLPVAKAIEIAHWCTLALIALDRTERVLSSYLRLQQLAPHDPEVLNGFAWWLVTTPYPAERDAKRAQAYVDEAISLHADRADYWNTRSVVELRLHQLESAAESLAKAQSLRPKASWMDVLVQAWLELERGERTTADRLLAQADASPASSSDSLPKRPVSAELERLLIDIREQVGGMSAP